jgi:N-acetylmuramoyl-L-alanine amidase
MLHRRLIALILLWLICPTAKALSFGTVVIDPGHGGKDGGCVWNNLIEKKLCLDVAQRLERILKSKGLHVVMTRRTDVFVALDRRASIANQHPRSVFVSLHFNASKNRAISGMEVFYRSASGQQLATKILRRMDLNLKGVNRGVFHGDYKVLRNTRMPAVLIECGYLSNRTDARRCADIDHRQTMAAAIASGILASRS